MKICYLCPDLGITVDGQKGASSHIRGFVSALEKLGHEVFIITHASIKEEAQKTPFFLIPQPDFLKEILKNEDQRTYRALKHILYNGAIENLLKEIIPFEKPDIVYERYSPFSVAGSAFCRQQGIPHVLEVNAPLAEQGKLYRKQALQEASELLEKTAFTKTSLIIALTENLKNWLVEEHGIAPEKIKVRPCGVNEKLFSPEGESYRQHFKGKVVLGFVGSLKPWHDVELLAKIFEKLASDPAYHLLVVGDGPMRKIIEDLSEKYPGRVTKTGAVKQEEVPKYIRAMDIALSPYPEMDLFYFSPLKVFEYMAVARPVIATGIGQLNDLIQNSVNGFKVDAGNVDAWTAVIDILSGDKELCRRIGTAAAYEIQAHHTWEKRALAFTEIAEDFLENFLAQGVNNDKKGVLQPF